MSLQTLTARLQPIVYDGFFWLAERLGMASRRRRVLSAARGYVLEIGAGTGLNLPFYGAAVDRLVLSEPDPAMAARLVERTNREARSVEVIEAGAERLPFPDDSFDTVVSTMVLCTVEDPAAALAEIARVLRPGGRLLFVEHVRGDRRLARRQDRVDPLWTRVALGCHCNRATPETLSASPLRIERLEGATWRGMPRIIRPLVVGEAVA